MCIGILTACATKYKLNYRKFNEGDKENWYGVAGPYITFFAAFDLRIKELSMEHGRLPVGKDESS